MVDVEAGLEVAGVDSANNQIVRRDLVVHRAAEILMVIDLQESL